MRKWFKALSEEFKLKKSKVPKIDLFLHRDQIFKKAITK